MYRMYSIAVSNLDALGMDLALVREKRGCVWFFHGQAAEPSLGKASLGREIRDGNGLRGQQDGWIVCCLSCVMCCRYGYPPCGLVAQVRQHLYSAVMHRGLLYYLPNWVCWVQWVLTVYRVRSAVFALCGETSHWVSSKLPLCCTVPRADALS